MQGLNVFSLLLITAGSSIPNPGCAQVGQESKPNILFCIADDATWMHMGAYGCRWVKTPNFDRVAKNGLLFTHAYTPNAKCAPSRASILTGRNSWQMEAAANHNCFFPSHFKTIAEALHEGGYQVGYTGKGWAPGDPGEIDGKKRDLLVKRYNGKTCVPPTSGISNVDYAANFEQFLNDRKPGKPFFFWYGGLEPHRKYEYGSGIKKGHKSLGQIDSVFSIWPDVDSVRTDLLDYAYEIEYFDKHLGEILKLLERTGELDNTLVLVTADNGMPFPRIKGQEYEYSNHLPLAVMWGKGIKYPGRVIDDYISFIDFAATFAAVSGVDVYRHGMSPIEGQSMTDIFQSTKSGQIDRARNSVLWERNQCRAPMSGISVNHPMDFLLRTSNGTLPRETGTGYTNTDGSPTKSYILNLRRGGEDCRYWKLNFGLRPEEELYDLVKDPDCVSNLADKPAFLAVKKQLHDRMYKELVRQGDPRVLGNGDVFDNYPTSVNANLYERFIKEKR